MSAAENQTSNPTIALTTISVVENSPSSNPTIVATTDFPMGTPPTSSPTATTSSPTTKKDKVLLLTTLAPTSTSFPSLAPSPTPVVAVTETQVDTPVNIVLTPEDIFGRSDAKFADDDSIIEIIEEPLNGDVTVQQSDYGDDVKFDYTPNEEFEGIDVFSFSACDNNGKCVPLRIQVSVTAPEQKGKEGLYALLSLLLAPLLCIFQEPLKRFYDKCMPRSRSNEKETSHNDQNQSGRGGQTTITNGGSGVTSGIPTSIGCMKDQTSIASETSTPEGNDDDFQDEAGDSDDDDDSSSSDNVDDSSNSCDEEDFSSGDFASGHFSSGDCASGDDKDDEEGTEEEEADEIL